jgi:hypothetical protein
MPGIIGCHYVIASSGLFELVSPRCTATSLLFKDILHLDQRPKKAESLRIHNQTTLV